MSLDSKKLKRHLSAVSLSLALLICGCSTAPQTPPDADTTHRHYSAASDTAEDSSGNYRFPDAEWLGSLIPGGEMQMPTVNLSFPSSTREYSPTLAAGALTLCSGHTEQRQAELLTQAGFEIIVRGNYDKPDSDVSHTCAWMLARREIIYNSAARMLYIIAIRGTNAGEWYSNFDFAPSHSDTTAFAENFLFAAEDVLMGVLEPLTAAAQSGETPLVLVCGHSRGAACANLLGMLLNSKLGVDNVSTYTFATPTTFRGDDCAVDCSNIFNIINPNDIVTGVPLAAWGFRRLGTDIELMSDGTKQPDTQAALEVLHGIAPTVSRYYTERHSLTSPGTSDNGLTAFELMLALTTSVKDSAKSSDTSQKGLGALDAISEDSDFAPLVTLLRSVVSDDGKLCAEVVRNHLPTTYLELLYETIK